MTSVDAGDSVDFAAIITAGNGSVDQHTVDGDCDNGSISIGGITVSGTDLVVNGTYTAPNRFEGEATCTYTVTDEDGAGDAVDGIIIIDVASGLVVQFPGAGSSLSPLTILVLLPLILLGRRIRGTVPFDSRTGNNIRCVLRMVE